MTNAPDPTDPWDPRGLPFTRLWPVYAGIAAGGVLALVWLALGRPALSFTPFLVIGGALAGAIAAALAPEGRRSTRFLDVAYPALVAGVATRFFSAIGVLVTGHDDAGDGVDTALVYFLALVFFVGFPLLVAKVFQSPARRLPDPVLAQIGEPYPTRREPRLVTIRAGDGSTHRVSVLRGGYVAGIRVPFDVATASGVVRDGTVVSGPRGTRSTRDRSDGRTGPSRSSSVAVGGGDGPTPTRITPAPTSRTTPKGTRSGHKRGKR